MGSHFGFILAASNGDTVMDPRLRAAALKRDLAALDRALDEGADPNAMDADGYTPLIFAVCNNNTDCVAKLIEAGACPNCYTDKGRTPLNSAASSGYTETIRVLLAGGAQVDFVPPYGYASLTPLHYAIDFGHARAIRALLAAGADANRRTESEFASDRVSPLFRAIKFSRTVANHSILPSLLRAGASINEPGVTELFQLLDETNAFISPTERRVIEYVQAVHTAGSFQIRRPLAGCCSASRHPISAPLVEASRGLPGLAAVPRAP